MATSEIVEKEILKLYIDNLDIKPDMLEFIKLQFIIMRLEKECFTLRKKLEKATYIHDEIFYTSQYYT